MNWDEAISILDESDFPEDGEGWKSSVGNETHKEKKTTHELTTYMKQMEPIGDYNLLAKYNYCKECKQIRNKVIHMYNNEDRLVYDKWFVYKGDSVNSKNLVEMAREVFANLIIILTISGWAN